MATVAEIRVYGTEAVWRNENCRGIDGVKRVAEMWSDCCPIWRSTQERGCRLVCLESGYGSV